jgi:predicted kinase
MVNNNSNYKGVLMLLRGLPGSGKSTLATILSEEGKYPVFSIDDYFTDKDGVYKFDYLENHKAYKACELNVQEAMSAGVAKIFVHNTFTIDWEMEPYIKLANENSYMLHVVTVENYHGSKNIHDIPDEHVARMKEKYKIRI